MRRLSISTNRLDRHKHRQRRSDDDETWAPPTNSTLSMVSGASAPLTDQDSEGQKRSGRLAVRAVHQLSGRLRVKKDHSNATPPTRERLSGRFEMEHTDTSLPDVMSLSGSSEALEAGIRSEETIDPQPGMREVRRKGSMRLRHGNKLFGLRQRYVEVKGTTMLWRKTPAGAIVEMIQLRACVLERGRKPTDVVVQHPMRTCVLRLNGLAQRESWFITLQRAAFDRVKDYYTLQRRIGVGTFGAVYEAVCNDTNRSVAIKTVDRVKVRHPKELEFIQREINIIRRLDHPRIVKALEIFDGGDKVHFVMELLAGGDLFDAIADERNFSEQKAAIIIHDILTAVSYLHSKDIVHRDLKPENILCSQRDWPIDIKLADFGTARFSKEVEDQEQSTMSTVVGTAFYLAPEVLDGRRYSFPVDLWSCGVILYAIIAGRLPWPAHDERKYCEHARQGLKGFPESEWLDVSDECKDLVMGLLQVDPERRITATQALEHPWLAPKAASIRRIQTDRSLLSSQSRRGWKQAESFLRRREKNATSNLGSWQQPKQTIDENASGALIPNNLSLVEHPQSAGDSSPLELHEDWGALDRQRWRQAWSEVEWNARHGARNSSAVLMESSGAADTWTTAKTLDQAGARASPHYIADFPSAGDSRPTDKQVDNEGLMRQYDIQPFHSKGRLRGSKSYTNGSSLHPAGVMGVHAVPVEIGRENDEQVDETANELSGEEGGYPIEDECETEANGDEDANIDETPRRLSSGIPLSLSFFPSPPTEMPPSIF